MMPKAKASNATKVKPHFKTPDDFTQYSSNEF